jgi:hypothetical protein
MTREKRYQEQYSPVKGILLLVPYSGYWVSGDLSKNALAREADTALSSEMHFTSRCSGAV